MKKLIHRFSSAVSIICITTVSTLSYATDSCPPMQKVQQIAKSPEVTYIFPITNRTNNKTYYNVELGKRGANNSDYEYISIIEPFKGTQSSALAQAQQDVKQLHTPVLATFENLQLCVYRGFIHGNNENNFEVADHTVVYELGNAQSSGTMLLFK